MTLVGGRPYGGTGVSLGELQDLPRRDRLAILAGTVALRRTEIDELKRQLTEAESYLLQEMGDAGATVLDAGEWEIKLTQPRRYTYDLECLSQLQAFLEPEQYEEIMVPVPATVNVSKNALNKYRKHGATIAAIIDAGTAEVPSPSRLEIKRP
jgi:hypothetical protein